MQQDIGYITEDIKTYWKKFKSSTSAFKLQYHIVINVKYKRNVLYEDIARDLKDLILDICEKNQYILYSLDIQPDNIHLAIGLKPSHYIPDVIQNLKGATSTPLRKKYPELKAVHPKSLWSDGYSIDTIGDANIFQIIAYLNRQAEHHRKSSLIYVIPTLAKASGSAPDRYRGELSTA